ncbi:hypothetical protein D3C81_1147070 [compost metagenome]
MLLLVQLLTGFRGLVHLRQRIHPLQAQQQEGCDHEAGGRREDQRQADVDGLAPVHAFAQRHVGEQRVGQAHTEDRTDQGVGAGRRNAEVPGAQVPGNGGGEQGENHGQSMTGVHIDQHLHRQQVNDGIRHADTAEQHAKEVEHPGEEHRQVRGHGFGINDCSNRVSGVMKAIDELEGEYEGQSEQQAHQYPGIKSAE